MAREKLEGKVGCEKVVMDGQFRTCSDKPSESGRKYNCQGSTIYQLDNEKFVSKYICLRKC